MSNEIPYEQGGEGHYDLPPGVYRLRHIPLSPVRPSVSTFYNTEQAYTAYFSACGYLDDQRTVITAARAYTSQLSQPDADAKALQAAQVSAESQLQHVLDTGFTGSVGGIDTFECYDGTAIMNSWGGWTNPWSGGDNPAGAVLASVTDNARLAGDFVFGSNQDVIHDEGQRVVTGFSVGTLFNAIISGTKTDNMALMTGFSQGTLLDATIFGYGTIGMSLVTGFSTGILFDTLIFSSGTEGMPLVSGFTIGTLLDVSIVETKTENMGLVTGFYAGTLA